VSAEAEQTTAEGVDLAAIASASFRATREADRIGQRLKDRFGLAAHYMPARLAMALSLRNPNPPEPAEGEAGRVIRGENLFGAPETMATWVSLFIEHAGRPIRSVQDLQRVVRDHWVRGAHRLDRILEETGNDELAFWKRLAELTPGAGLPPPPTPVSGGEPLRDSIPLGPEGTDVRTGGKVAFSPCAPGNSPHVAIMGGVGSGKTRTAVFMLERLRENTQVPLIAFDFKGDLAEGDLERAFGAKIVEVPQSPIPLDVLALDNSDDNAVALAAQRLRDSLTTLRGTRFGTQQRDLLATATERALRRRIPCRLSDIRDALVDLYEQQGRSHDGAVSTLNDLCRFVLFEPVHSPSEFFRESWIIRLRQDLPDLVRSVIVTLVTDALDRWLNSLPDSVVDANGYRALRVVALIDEAHRVLGCNLPGLSNLVRFSRSKGGMIWLISQSPDDFQGEDDDFLAETGLVIAFATHARPGATRRIFGPEARLERLGKGEAWVRIRGESAARRVQIWKPLT